MKKILTIALVAVSILALGTTAFALIADSHHDLSAAAARGNVYATANAVSACEFCHAPHHALTTVGGAPLWNRSLPASASFTMYGNTIAGTTVDQTLGLGQNSLTCLSCHDGATAIGNLVNKTFMGDTNQPVMSSPLLTGYANVDTDLQNDHPVGFTFVAGRADVAAVAAPFKLYSGTFECASCHDPHDDATGATDNQGAADIGGSAFFLRADLATICTDCHAK